MRAILALAFVGAVAASYTLTPAYQEYTVYYEGPGCVPSSAFYIYQDYSYESTCTDGTCTSSGLLSYKRVCTSGAPVNLGFRRWDLSTTCSAATTLPLYDYWMPSGLGISSDRTVYGIESFKAGCVPDDYYSTYYNFVSVTANGGFVNDNGNCGQTAGCVATDCTSADDYTLAAGTSGCDSTATDGFIELTVTAPTIAADSDLFEIDYDTYVFPNQYPYYCCKLTGDCNCCVADGDSCCNPSELESTYNTCCDDNTAVANNTLSMKLFQACLCDQDGEERGTYDASTNTCTPNDTSDGITSNATITSDTAEQACDYLKVFAWCNAHALQDEQYYIDIGDEASWETNSEFVGETEYYYIGATGASDEATGADPCFTFGGYFQPSSDVGTLYDMNLVDFCDVAAKGIASLGFECDAFCASGNTLAFAALLAFF